MRLALASLLALVLLPLAFTGPPAIQVDVLVGTCVDDSGGPVKGTVEVHFDVEGDAGPVVTRTAEIQKDGSYRVDVPEGAWAAFTRARIGRGLHHGPQVWFRGLRPAKEHTLDPITCGPLHRGSLTVTDAEGEAPDAGDVLYYPIEVHVDASSLCSPAARECYAVATIDGRETVGLPPLPRRGGRLRVESEGSTVGVCELVFDAGSSTFSAELQLTAANVLRGTAPGKALVDPGGDADRVVLATLGDSAGDGWRPVVAVAYLPDSDRPGPPVTVAFGEDFETLAAGDGSPILGAWPQRADVRKERPALIARADPATGRYARWIAPEPATYAIDLGDWSAKERARLGSYKMWGNLSVRTIWGFSGQGIQAKVRDDLLLVTCDGVCPTEGTAELSIQADGAELLRERVPLETELVRFTPDRLASTTETTFVVTDARTGAPLPGAKIEVVGPSEHGMRVQAEITCDDEGKGRGLFVAGAELRVVPDKLRLRTADGEELVYVPNGVEDTLEVEVVESLGTVVVTAGDIDTQPFRVSLIPDTLEDDGTSTRYPSQFPQKGPSVDPWKLEAHGPELAAFALRPGKSCTFGPVPEGSYVVAVQTGLDLGARTVYVDPKAALGHRYARRVEVIEGEVTEVELAPGEVIEAELAYTLSKNAEKTFRRSLGGRDKPRAVAQEVLGTSHSITIVEGAKPVPLEWTRSRTLKGPLEVGATYLVHLEGACDVDSAHVIEVARGEQPPLRLDAAVEFTLDGVKNRPVEIEITTHPCDIRGTWVIFDLAKASVTLRPKRGKVLLDGLSPYAHYDIVLRQDGKSASVRIEPLAGDAETERDKRSRAQVKRMELWLR